MKNYVAPGAVNVQVRDPLNGDQQVEIFGDRGKHTRAAFGVAQVPFGSCVEIDLVAEVR